MKINTKMIVGYIYILLKEEHKSKQGFFRNTNQMQTGSQQYIDLY